MISERARPEGFQTLLVSHKTETAKIGGSIAWALRDKGYAEVSACGAGAVNQAVKGLAQARMYLSMEYRDIVCRPRFTTVEMDGQEKTVMVFEVELVDQE